MRPARVRTPRAWPSRSSPVLESAMSSSSVGARPDHSASRCAMTRQVSPMRSRYCTVGSAETRIEAPAAGAELARAVIAGSHVVERLGQLVEGRMAVDLVGHRIEERRLVARVAGRDLVGAHDP